MHFFTFGEKDTTLYEATSSLNAGLDEILEIRKDVSEDGETGLYGAYKAGGPYGVLPKNPSEIVLRENRPVRDNGKLKTRKEVESIKDKIWKTKEI